MSYTARMGLLGKLGVLAALLAFALAAAVVSPSAGASSYVSAAVEQTPDPCAKTFRHCETIAVAATAHPQPLDFGAAARTRFAASPLPAGARRVPPHRPASLSILFRNFRE